MNHEELLAEMEHLVEAGDKAALEKFTVDHFNEFTKEVQGKLLMGFYLDYLEEHEGNDAVRDIQQKGLDAIKQLEAVKKEISDAKLEES